MEPDETYFDQFWAASSLDRFSVQEFAQQLNNYDSDDKQLALEYAATAQALPLPRTPLNRIAQKRGSDRIFSSQTLSRKELGRLFSSFHAWNDLEHRAYPSAGATYVTELFCVGFNAEGLSGNVAYYDAKTHGMITVSENAPDWKEAAQSLNIEVTGTPQALVLFVLFPERAIAKYGERGGRFAMLEAGAAMQQLSLQIAASPKLKGVATGGALDSVWKQVLRLDNTNAHIALGYLVGK